MHHPIAPAGYSSTVAQASKRSSSRSATSTLFRRISFPRRFSRDAARVRRSKTRSPTWPASMRSSDRPRQDAGKYRWPIVRGRFRCLDASRPPVASRIFFRSPGPGLVVAVHRNQVPSLLVSVQPGDWKSEAAVQSSTADVAFKNTGNWTIRALPKPSFFSRVCATASSHATNSFSALAGVLNRAVARTWNAGCCIPTAILTSERRDRTQKPQGGTRRQLAQATGGLLTSQCFFGTSTARSVSLTVTRANPAGGSTLSPRAYRRQQFHRDEHEKERDTEARLIAGVGEEAYW